VVLRPDQEARLAELRAAVDVYGDLLVADAVFDVVSGRGDTAGASMEAAAGLDLPPELDLLRTPREGDTRSTTLLAALPYAERPALVDGMSPVRLVEPSFAAHIASTFPAPDQWSWTREDRVRQSDGRFETVQIEVTLAELELDVVDLVALRPEQVAGLVLERTAGAPSVQPSVRTDTTGPRWHARLVRLATTIRGTTALPSRIAADAHLIDRTQDDDVRDELLNRYAAAHSMATSLLAELEVAAPADASLASARRFGIAPTPDPQAQTAADRRKDVVRKARETLAARLDQVPDPTVPTAKDLPADRIAQAMVDLVAPGGGLPILARVRRDQIASTADGGAAMTVEPRESMPLAGNAGAARNRLDRTWLATVAAVRASAARVEAYMLESTWKAWPSLHAWTNVPGDPWQQSAVRPDRVSARPLPALIAAYAPANTLDVGGQEYVAVSLLDSWTETVPSKEHTVTAAFGFNAPAARPPQAILVAVPPRDDVPLDVATLLGILGDTRELAHARMATLRDLHAYAALPMSMVQSFYSDPAGVELSAWEASAP
jgi:hypothetical protein